jgi:hypothetical protein
MDAAAPEARTAPESAPERDDDAPAPVTTLIPGRLLANPRRVRRA